MRHSAAFSQEIGLQLVFASDSGSYDMEKKQGGYLISKVGCHERGRHNFEPGGWGFSVTGINPEKA